ncbi:MAG: hypothetical protein OEW17_02475 [Gemmatimonadota bacterium]|nr:hypothetical protein [Gemmatimonadota bacterium]MDH4347647.1 hypothetical protein [Gemmatimonadota bacterium]
MRSLWLRITLGALAVFAVGTTAVHLGRKAKSTIQHTLQSDAPLPIPLAGLVPFRVDNNQLGSLRKLEFLRSSPSEVSGMRVLVDMSNDSAGQGLMDCMVGLRSVDNIDEHITFACISPDSLVTEGLEPFGFVFLGSAGDSVPLVLPHDAVAEFRSARLDFRRHGIHIGHAGDSVQVDVKVDSIRRVVAKELERAAVELDRAREELGGAAPVPPEPPAPATVNP